jgi:hypothetical protein
MFEKFQLLYQTDQESGNILEVEEVNLHDACDINEWRFGGGIAPRENELQRYLNSP